MLVGEQEADVGSVADMLEGILESQADRAHLISHAVTDLFHDPECLERRDTLSRRWKLEHTRASERAVQRRRPAGRVIGKVGLREPADGRDPRRERTAIES